MSIAFGNNFSVDDDGKLTVTGGIISGEIFISNPVVVGPKLITIAGNDEKQLRSEFEKRIKEMFKYGSGEESA